MKTAYDAGVNFFDNAESYAQGNAETVMGNGIKKVGWRRSDLVVPTKIFRGGRGPNEVGLSRKHIIEGMNASLRRLQMDYVDLVFCHRPDIRTPIEETVWAMNILINQGKALYWGTSEWSEAQILDAYHSARREHLIPPQMEQPQYNMFHRERVEKEYARLYTEIGLGTTIFSPLASGLLTGKYNNGIPEGTRATLSGYEWLHHRSTGFSLVPEEPHVSAVITGASRPEQVIENMKAIDCLDKLTDDVMEWIEGILGNKPTPESDFR